MREKAGDKITRIAVAFDTLRGGNTKRLHRERETLTQIKLNATQASRTILVLAIVLGIKVQTRHG